MADVSLEVYSKRPVSQTTTTEMGPEKKKIRFETTLNSMSIPLGCDQKSKQFVVICMVPKFGVI